VLAGAASQADAALLAPVLVGSVDLSHHRYRLVTGQAPHRLADGVYKPPVPYLRQALLARGVPPGPGVMTGTVHQRRADEPAPARAPL
jgi:hypothetical protein